MGIYYGAKDNFLCIFIGLDLHSYNKFPVIRERNFTLLTFLPEEFGSTTILHLFRKRLLQQKVLTNLVILCTRAKFQTKSHNASAGCVDSVDKIVIFFWSPVIKFDM